MLEKNEISEYLKIYLHSLPRLDLLEIAEEWAIDQWKLNPEKFQYPKNNEDMENFIFDHAILKGLHSKDFWICPKGCHWIYLKEIQSPLTFENKIRKLEYKGNLKDYIQLRNNLFHNNTP